ncbi:MAG: hypothetical protein AAGO57_09845, partial [Pseudomonadota bacterium]
QLVEEMEKRSEKSDIIGFFPTLIFGGGEPPVHGPQSHFVRMLFENRKWIPVVRRLSVEGLLHVIHPADIATLAGHFGASPSQGRNERIILGNEPVSVNGIIKAVAKSMGRRHRPWLKITENRVEAAAKFFGIKMTSWDRHNAFNSDKSYPSAVMPGDFGLPTAMPDIESGLRAVGFPKR